ncbi:MAG TPA: hypothetical protein VMT35_10005, partial [Ignavibacteriaceae bacterium]|nr:hypothetical protein [Ignavibacteriaceae bacterium]
MAFKFFFPFLFLISGIYPQSSLNVQNKIDELLQDQFFNSTLIAADIYNLSKQEVIYQRNEKMLLHP